MISQFVDLDLIDSRPSDQGSGFIDQDQSVFRAGVNCEDFENFGNDMVPRSQWEEMAAKMEKTLRKTIRTVLNQGREGSCVGNGCVGAAMSKMYLQYGKDFWRPLSAMSIYNRIGRSAQSGAYIPDGINEMTDEGPLPLDTPENKELYDVTYRARGFVGERSFVRSVPGWEDVAGLFRVTKVRRINTVEGWFSALVRGIPIVYGRDGHCIFSLFPKLHRGDWYFGYVNSWGQWGDQLNDIVGKGLGWDSERKIKRCVGYGIEEIAFRPLEMAV